MLEYSLQGIMDIAIEIIMAELRFRFLSAVCRIDLRLIYILEFVILIIRNSVVNIRKIYGNFSRADMHMIESKIW